MASGIEVIRATLNPLVRRCESKRAKSIWPSTARDLRGVWGNAVPLCRDGPARMPTMLGWLPRCSLKAPLPTTLTLCRPRWPHSNIYGWNRMRDVAEWCTSPRSASSNGISCLTLAKSRSRNGLPRTFCSLSRGDIDRCSEYPKRPP